jgi:O-antigen/teichoic acid export membrane protein
VLAGGAIGLVCFVVELPSCTFLFIAAMTVPFLALNALRSSFLRGLGFVVLSNVPEQLVLPVVVVLLIGLTYPLSSIDGESWALSLQLTGTICAFVIGFVLLARRLPQASVVAPGPEQGQLFRAAMPFLGLVALQLLNNQATVVLLGALGDASDAGLYHVAVRATEFIAFGLLAVNMMLQPRMAAAWAARDRARAQALATESARLSSMVAIAVSLVVIGFAPTILGLFGPEFSAARDSLWLLAVGQLINVFAGSCGVTLSMAGYQRSVTRAFAVVATISVLLNVLLIPMFGHLGAATARVVSLVVWNAILVVEAYRKMGVYTPVIGWRALRRNA